MQEREATAPQYQQQVIIYDERVCVEFLDLWRERGYLPTTRQ